MFDDGDEVEDDGDGERDQGWAVERGGFTQQEVCDIDEPGGVEGGGDTEPEEAHFLHLF